ncbi:MAG: cation:proton antiporter [Acidimicrobiia bacterium]|nr:cation:proton antiporter [Acidimicrobiia bacterium]
MTWQEIQEGPAFGFTVIGLIVVFGPLIAERLRVPGLLGLLVGGALIGPNVFDVLPDFGSLEDVGSIGVLYLIFLAGLQLDIESFLENRNISIGFGLLTAFIPFGLGTVVALGLDMDLAAALLIGSFWASFTLIAYPTVSRFGLTRNRAVSATVGASSITDTISLTMLALIIGAETGDSKGWQLVISIAAGLVVVAIWCFLVVPLLARWFFSGLGQERTLRYMFVFVALTSSAVVADLVAIEPLIAAFFVGVGLNRLVPNASPLMMVTDFFGNAFFIPTFLISVGLLLDPDVMFAWETIRLALWFAVALFVGKALAAWISGRIFGLTGAEVGVMLSMSVAQAAATLAATIVGLEAGIYGDDVVNAVMLVVAVSLVVTSVGTSHFAPGVPPPASDQRRPGEQILLPVGSDVNVLRRVIPLTERLTASAGGVVQPAVVVTSADRDSIARGRAQQANTDSVFRQAGQDVETMLRINRSLATGLSSAAVETDASLLLLPWLGREGAHSALFGASYSEVIAASAVPVAIAAFHDSSDGGHRRAFLLVRDSDLDPGQEPALRLAAQFAHDLVGRDQVLRVGPLSPDSLVRAGVSLPEHVEHAPGPDDPEAWAEDQTRQGDLVIVPFHALEMRPPSIRIFDSGRSVLAVTHNPESQLGLSASTLTLPVGSSFAP